MRHKAQVKVVFLAIKSSLIIYGFKILGTLLGRNYVQRSSYKTSLESNEMKKKDYAIGDCNIAVSLTSLHQPL